MWVAARLLAASLSALALAAVPKPFAIIRAGIHQMEDGPFVPVGATHVPGETVFFSFQVEGYQISPKRRVSLSYQIDAVDPAGTVLMEPVSGKVDTELSEEDKNWTPKVRQSIMVPPFAGSGTYKIAVAVKDELSGATAKQDFTFQVEGHQVAASPTLVVRNFRFYRAEDDLQPLSVAAYRPRDPIWARFDITGYKFGEGNQVDVDYGIAVLDQAGTTLFSQNEAAVEKSASFYPQRYVPAIISLNLDPKIKPEQYTIVITVRDKVGNQTYESRESFRIE